MNNIWTKYKNAGDRIDGMKILIISDFHIAGQQEILFRTLNEKTNHCARMAIIHKDYLAYDGDIIATPEETPLVRELIASADIIHVNRNPEILRIVGVGLDVLKPTNSLVQYWGSDIRGRVRESAGWHTQTGILGLSAWDETMLDRRGLMFYHIPLMVDLSKLSMSPPVGDKVKICHDSTNRTIKKTAMFEFLMKELVPLHPIEYTIIEGKSNKECLEIKSQHNIFYAEIGLGCYGMSAMECMGMGMPVLSSMDNFALSVYPNCPVIAVNEMNLKDKILDLVYNRERIGEFGTKGVEWVRNHHSPDVVVKQYCHLYDYIKNGRHLV